LTEGVDTNTLSEHRGERLGIRSGSTGKGSAKVRPTVSSASLLPGRAISLLVPKDQ
jgi:hypothetical protein